jgi:riboflavin synthase
VDGTARVRATQEDGEALTVTFEVAPELARFIVEKGYVAIDGASLTVVGTDPQGFSVTLVPHTRANVVFGAPEVGYVANLEVDVMAKYVERIVGARLGAIEARLADLERDR